MVAQVFVRVLDGTTRCLAFEDAASLREGVAVAALARRLEASEGVPAREQAFACGATLFTPRDASRPRLPALDEVSCHLLLRVAGGKGGFGSLLRASRSGATTTNFDACRDLSGRRIRHVNAERKLAEDQRREKERELERAALKHINETRSSTKRKLAEIEEAERKRYREETAKVIGAVSDAVGAGLRERASEDAQEAANAEAKKRAERRAMKRVDAYMGLGLGGTSESDDSESESESESEPEDRARDASEEEDKKGKAPARDPRRAAAGPAAAGASGSGGGSTRGPPSKESSTSKEEEEKTPPAAAPAEETPPPAEETIALSDFPNAAALERFGLDRLKAELAERGLKCGGTLAQRAERLWLLRDKTLEEVDEKHRAPKKKKE
jgi:hypothetical protein